MKNAGALLFAMLLFPAGAAAQAGAPYRNAGLPVAERVRDLLGRMTLNQKIGQMGQINSYVLLGDRGSPWDWQIGRAHV